MNRRIMAALAGLGLGLLAGCEESEKLVYRSTPHVPQTVTLVNTATGEQLWSYDIPPSQELTIHFTQRPSHAYEAGYDEMTWTVGPAGQQPPAPKNRMKVPPPDSRRLDVTIRPQPELPNGEVVHRTSTPPTDSGK